MSVHILQTVLYISLGFWQKGEFVEHQELVSLVIISYIPIQKYCREKLAAGLY